MSPDDINENHQVLGRQVWRVIPYALRYPRRLVAGFLGNACARVVDLVPFVAIGWAVDYFTSNSQWRYRDNGWARYRSRCDNTLSTVTLQLVTGS